MENVRGESKGGDDGDNDDDDDDDDDEAAGGVDAGVRRGGEVRLGMG